MRKRVALLVVLAASVASAGAQAPHQGHVPQAAAKPAEGRPASGVKMTLEPRAMALLQAASERLAAAKSMSFTAVVGYEYPSRLGPPIVYSARYDVTMQRPDKLKVVMPGDGPASELYYDGKAMVAFAPAEGLAAFADAPPTLDAALKAAYETAAIYYPFTDLIVADPYAALTEGAKLAFYVGPSTVVGGTKTEMVAWANDDVFLQIWIGSEDKLPRRIRAIYRADTERLRHEMELSNWQLDAPVAAGAFSSEKAQSAQRVPFAHPVQPAAGAEPAGSSRKSQ
jgi:hypothetical protein